MWMNEAEEATFTNYDGRVAVVKEMKPITPGMAAMIEIDVGESDSLDEIASRREIYGEGTEDLSYIIFEENATTLMENNFSMSGIATLRIPA